MLESDSSWLRVGPGLEARIRLLVGPGLEARIRLLMVKGRTIC